MPRFSFTLSKQDKPALKIFAIPALSLVNYLGTVYLQELSCNNLFAPVFLQQCQGLVLH
ncbi:hypothetical protein SVI_3221 [Shewanella violacea DSS12]|uniref:Uncharacterized protein n=1 Tax=Shewanella violacea (strain JCM 10179 / CIP 106290 / LMG 19151 / DSS12) TaxID=637905 RepID=D4ZAZ6_SHEVD|nr:hypothetical protein SVI_3220 [Shewanella violacea DSS12]BAJ03192.1 hypothetical protein SVI_3221 [Shewanella violacea DSS12]